MCFRRGALCLVVVAVSVMLATDRPAAAENPSIGKRRLAERKVFTDAEIVDGFFKVTFGAEFRIAGNVDRIRKYDVPVRIRLDNRATPDRSGQVAAAIQDIRRRVRGLDIAVADKPGDANMAVLLVRDRDLPRTIRSVFGPERARRIQRSLRPQCLSGFRKDESFRIVQSTAIVVTDVSDFVFFDCVYEELLQALGPINDDASLPWTMFNDNVRLGFFGVFDQYLLNILYHPRIRPGMSREEVGQVLPEVLPQVRAFVAGNNRIQD